MLSMADWLIIAAYLVLSMVLGIICMRRGRASSEEYFKSGGGTSWWLLGTSIVATTFAADTPLALSGMVVTSGISQNWYWWCGVPATIGIGKLIMGDTLYPNAVISNRLMGIILLVIGSITAWIVARSFNPKKWSEH